MKRLSNKKYFWNGILWCLVGAFVLLGWTFFLMGCTTVQNVRTETAARAFCERWNTLGDDPMGEPVNVSQRKMFHLGHLLSKSEFVRITLNEHYTDGLFVDKVVTCYEENAMFLVDEVDGICACSKEDKREEFNAAFSNYLNDCVREINLEMNGVKKK